MPSGRFLMEDYYYAGGLPAVLRALGEHGLLDKDALTVTGQSMWDNVKDAPNWNTEVIRTLDNPHTARGGIIAPAGRSRTRRGGPQAVRSVPPSSCDTAAARSCSRPSGSRRPKINDDSLDVDETCVLVLKNWGPKGYPGMSEVGNMGLPPQVADARACATWSGSRMRA